MRYTKKVGYNGSIRKVWSNDKEVCYGIVGTVEDLLDANFFEYADFPSKWWAYVPAPGIIQHPRFGHTRDEALANLPH